MSNILVFTANPGYKTVRHAGGKINYAYLEKLQDNNNIKIISSWLPEENEGIKTSGLHAEYINALDYNFKSFSVRLINKFLHLTKITFHYFYVDHYDICRYLFLAGKLKKQGFIPDYIILDWTQSALLSKGLRRIFKNARISCIEQDVSFLGFERRYLCETDPQLRKEKLKQFKLLKKAEIYFLNKAHIVKTLNFKDLELLKKEPDFKAPVEVITPYFDDFSKISRTPDKNSIIFYGAMNRAENEDAVLWFMEKVFPFLPEDITFTIIGNKPSEKILSLQCDRVIVTGFVEDASPYFEKAMCTVVPLLLGAGIKIKVLEAFSAGIPVLTNSLGIEGIPAQNKVHYLHCEEPQEYIDAVNKLYNDSSLCQEISNNCRQLIEQKFKFENCSYI